MRLIKLLLLAAGAAYAYKRFVADPAGGAAATDAAEPFSSEQLGDTGPAPAEAQPAAAVATGDDQPADTLTRPTWLSPGDAG